MTQKEQKVTEIIDKVLGFKLTVPQIVINLCEEVEELLNWDDMNEEPLRRDNVGAMCYHIGIILDIIKPEMEETISFLNELDKALEEWRDDIEFINVTLGLPKES